MKTKSSDPCDWSQFIKPMTSFDGTHHEGVFPGLTKREYFAALALQGLTAHLGRNTGLALAAVQYADALIAELNRGKDET
jgi:hypothetical protein